ncbi:hypothetical protein SAMN05661010_02842 [Modicisalibacter muralis]|uniref:Uncharacterized protein n=1 Tax=Modicisalibacter muralis TaxID=119000 RepID=A0A1G9NTP8_9GAMM|nr:hypothetical protein [Halomonas muralis]SDL89375.1 hypothetical protein SAMN05661010_02842 [Halomonas muralis]
MKLQTTLAALVFAALPVAAQASVASEQGLLVNHEPLAHGAPNVEQTSAADIHDYRFAGSSAALAETQRNIIALGDQRTNFPVSNDNEAQIGNAADW